MNAPRPMARVRIEGVRVSSTRSIAIEVDRYEDVTLPDRMHARGQLSDRQHVAALRLYGLWLAAGQSPRTTGRLDTRPDEEPMDAAEEGDPDGDARDVLRGLLRQAGPVCGPILDAMCHGQHPGSWRLVQLQAGLDWLGDEWGMEKTP